MNINEAFPSSFLKAADLQGRQPTVTIARVEMQDIGDDRKPVVYFEGKDKGIVLNKTNATNIADSYGQETGNWIGKQVTLFTAWVDFQGRSVEAIRIRPAQQFTSGLPDSGQQKPAQQHNELNPPPASDNDLSDEVPF